MIRIAAATFWCSIPDASCASRYEKTARSTRHTSAPNQTVLRQDAAKPDALARCASAVPAGGFCAILRTHHKRPPAPAASACGKSAPAAAPRRPLEPPEAHAAADLKIARSSPTHVGERSASDSSTDKTPRETPAVAPRSRCG